MQKEQRIGLFVDVQNLYYSARNLYNKKVNFQELLKEAVKSRKLIRALAYVIKTEELKEKTFFDALEKLGYEIKSKDLQIFYGGHKKGDWDIGLAMDAIELAPKLDAIIIASGDGDFIPLAEYLKGKGMLRQFIWSLGWPVIKCRKSLFDCLAWKKRPLYWKK